MSDEIYHARLIAQARAATRAGRLEAPDASVTLHNPLCGDRVTIEVTLADGRIRDLAQRVRGCLLCEAAASAIGAHAIGETAESSEAVERGVAAMLAGTPPAPESLWPDLEAFAPVRAHKSRHRCVLLPFEALRAALSQARATRG